MPAERCRHQIMASTRHPTVDVFEDDAHAPFTGNEEGDVEKALMNALRPLSSGTNAQSMQLNPSTAVTSGASPTKTDSSPMRPISSHSLTDVKILPPEQPNFTTDSPQKNGNFYSLYQPLPPPQSEFSQFPATQPYDKENYYDASSFHGLPVVPYGEYDYSYDSLKRPLMDPTPARDRSKKQKTDNEEPEPFDLPDPKDLPPVHDDGSKPPHSTLR